MIRVGAVGAEPDAVPDDRPALVLDEPALPELPPELALRDRGLPCICAPIFVRAVQCAGARARPLVHDAPLLNEGREYVHFRAIELGGVPDLLGYPQPLALVVEATAH